MREEEQEKSRKRVSEVPISEEPPKRVRLSVDSLLGLSAEEENVVSALWELRYLSATAAPEAAAPATVAPATAAGETPAQVAAAPTDVSVLLERLIVCIYYPGETEDGLTCERRVRLATR